ncbi:MAG: hypothetical protein JST62_12040 [Bacteroidetes bacterium]|jgi:uncharacterized membrane protein|nr:hypothetical protein [Bacteroidota bacterium]
MEQTIKTLIYIHAFFGGLGLITGIISILAKKGRLNHKRAGKIFSYSIIISSLVSLFVARMPNHENLFLFLIGIFTIYLVLAGNRALTLRFKNEADWKDNLISGLMFIISTGMVLLGIYGLVQQIGNSILYLFFGAFGLFLTIKDFHTFKTFTHKKNAWLINHLGRMNGALIASITAFFVAGLNIQTIFIWFIPTILGTFYIIFWSKKLTSKAKPFHLRNEEQ